jgi:hypothetical protein
MLTGRHDVDIDIVAGQGAHNSDCEPLTNVSGRVGVEAAVVELAVPHSAGDHADAVRRSA